MRIFVISDIHFEFHDEAWLPLLPDEQDFDVLVLAGDIGTAEHALAGVDRLLNHYSQVPIILVLGNHEYYHDNLISINNRFRSHFKSYKRVHLLEEDVVEINGFRFLGCVFWSDFTVMGPTVEQVLLERLDEHIGDFRLIDEDDPSNRGEAPRKLTPVSMQAMHRKSFSWLNDKLSAGDVSKTIVITHFPPTLDARNDHFVESPVSAYFQANGLDLIKKYKPPLWLYGHNHYSRVDREDETLLVSNQWGYPSENTGYTVNCIVEYQSGEGWVIG